MKEIVLDTETTGISIKDGHRIVEIGCIELENLIPTKNKFQKIQLSSQYKIRKSDFIMKNDFTKKTINTSIKNVLKKINQ